VSYIQCKDEAEAEALFKKGGHRFMSPDFRLYDTIIFADEGCYIDLNSEVVLDLWNLKSQLEMAADSEQSFSDLERACKEASACFNRVAKSLGIGKRLKLKVGSP
jgi:hypothetical protein